jgi:hypothetical protein
MIPSSTVTSRWRSSRRPQADARAVSRCVLLVLPALLFAAPTVTAAESVRLLLQPAFVDPFAAPAEGPFIEPADGGILVVGRFDRPDFGIADVTQIEALAPDGRQLPLRIDAGSVCMEFDRIVSLRLAFEATEAEAEDAPGEFTLRWGPEIAGPNASVESLAIDPARLDSYRGFTWAEPAGALGDDTQFASIEVIADSTAEYHFLYYLLPVALIFTLLTIRKIRARHSTA